MEVAASTACFVALHPGCQYNGNRRFSGKIRKFGNCSRDRSDDDLVGKDDSRSAGAVSVGDLPGLAAQSRGSRTRRVDVVA
jgi:hypothetical protein